MLAYRIALAGAQPSSPPRPPPSPPTPTAPRPRRRPLILELGVAALVVGGLLARRHVVSSSARAGRASRRSAGCRAPRAPISADSHHTGGIGSPAHGPHRASRLASAGRSAQPAAESERAAPAATLPARVLSLQRSAGNAAVVRMLARYAGDELKLAAASTKGGSKKGRIDVPSATVYDAPGGNAIAELPEGAPVRVLSTEGEQWTIEHDGKRAYVSWMDVEISNETRKVTLEQLFKVYPGLAADARRRSRGDEEGGALPRLHERGVRALRLRHARVPGRLPRPRLGGVRPVPPLHRGDARPEALHRGPDHGQARHEVPRGRVQAGHGEDEDASIPPATGATSAAARPRSPTATTTSGPAT